MIYEQKNFSGMSVASVQTSDSIFTAQVTIDIHESNSLQTQAIGLVYEEVLLAGAGLYSREEFLDKVSGLGAALGVQYVNGRLHVVLRSSAEQSAKLISLFKLLFQSPAFAEKEIQRVKVLLKNQLKEHGEDAKERAHELLTNTLFENDDRRYVASPEDLLIAVQKVTRTDLESLHEVVLNNFFVISVSAAAPVQEQFKRTLQNIKKTTKTTRSVGAHSPKMVPSKKLVLVDVPSKQNIEFSIGGPLPITLHHPDYVPFLFGLNVLGKWGGFTGRLMSTVREKEGLTYGIYARIESVSGDETGMWRIMTFFSPTNTEKALRSVAREIGKIYKDGITKSEYDRFLSILNTQQILLQDSAIRALQDLHSFQVAGFSVEQMVEHKEQLFQVQRKDVNRAIKTYLNPGHVIVCGAGPVASVQKSLKKEFGDGII